MNRLANQTVDWKVSSEIVSRVTFLHHLLNCKAFHHLSGTSGFLFLFSFIKVYLYLHNGYHFPGRYIQIIQLFFKFEEGGINREISVPVANCLPTAFLSEFNLDETLSF